MNKVLPMLLATCAFAACKPRGGELPGPPTPQSQRDATRALGSTVPEPDFGHNYWQKQHDTDTSQWQEAKRLCEQTVLANYPNCLPIRDIVAVDQRRKAIEANKLESTNNTMLQHGYQYDFSRKSWLPFRQLMSLGCVSVPAYPNDSRRIGFSTWKCPHGESIPTGIPDVHFGKEEEYATE
jgi:hypothetical protein